MSQKTMVVSAAIVFDGRVLLAQRAAETSHAFKWCTPGGKIEPGEEPSAALRRELWEELSIGLAAFAPMDVAYQADVGDRVRVVCEEQAAEILGRDRLDARRIADEEHAKGDERTDVELIRAARRRARSAGKI